MGGGGSHGGNNYANTAATYDAYQLRNMSDTAYNNLFVGQELPLLFGVNPSPQAGNYGDASGGAFKINQSPWGSGGVGSPGGSGNFSSFGAPGQIMQQAFDPQQQLYNRSLQQTTDGLNSQLSMSGLGGSPLGAAAMGSTLGNFNIDWQNNLLNREITGANAASGLYNQAYQGVATAAQPLSSSAQSFGQVGNTLSQAQTADANRSSSMLSGLLGKGLDGALSLATGGGGKGG